MKFMVAQSALSRAQEESAYGNNSSPDRNSQNFLDDGQMSISTATGTGLTFSNKLIDPKTGLSRGLIDKINLKASIISQARK
jgi:hypothetical protein